MKEAIGFESGMSISDGRVCGHTHAPNDFLWHGVRMICNPLGYPQERNDVRNKQIVLSSQITNQE